MKLKLWLSENKISLQKFADLIDVPTSRTVHRYVTGERIPAPPMMQKIKDETGGAVMANDFYYLSEGRRTASPSSGIR